MIGTTRDSQNKQTKSKSLHLASSQLTRDVASTFVPSHGDFDGEEWYCEDPNDGSSCHDATGTRRFSNLLKRISSLPVISELSETLFEPLFDYSEEMLDGDYSILPPPMLGPSSIESRWSPNSKKELLKQLASPELMMPERVPSNSHIPFDDELSEPSMDVPLKVPIRAKSLSSMSSLEDDDLEDLN